VQLLPLLARVQRRSRLASNAAGVLWYPWSEFQRLVFNEDVVVGHSSV
jgi:hypothetical protein